MVIQFVFGFNCHYILSLILFLFSFNVKPRRWRAPFQPNSPENSYKNPLVKVLNIIKHRDSATLSNGGVKPNSMTPKPVPEDQLLDQALRPKTFDEYIGQNRIKENLKVVIGAAKKR